MLMVALDAAYAQNRASAACVAFGSWEAHQPTHELTVRHPGAAAYEPGAFYKRELPLLLAVLNAARVSPDVIIIDGYVWLDAARRPGLGAHLHAALAKPCAVVGIAKSAFADSDCWAETVVRGTGKRPLYVTAIGMAAGTAAEGVRRMHGRHRIPTLVRRADRLARQALR